MSSEYGNDTACQNCANEWGNLSDDTSYYGGICDDCFREMPIGEWVSSWPVTNSGGEE